MEQFNVTGMSCAACSARVEKAVKSVPGVTGCSVSLLTNSMGVEGTAEDAAIIRAVEQAGYGASPKKAAAAASTSAELDALADHETPKLKRRLIASLGFLLVLMYSDFCRCLDLYHCSGHIGSIFQSVLQISVSDGSNLYTACLFLFGQKKAKLQKQWRLFNLSVSVQTAEK